MANKKVVVAFSGGLDTSYTVMKLTQDGWDVYAACANTGGFSAEQLKTNEENAYKLGAKAYVTLDVTHEYYEKSLKYMIFGNVLTVVWLQDLTTVTKEPRWPVLMSRELWLCCSLNSEEKGSPTRI